MLKINNTASLIPQESTNRWISKKVESLISWKVKRGRLQSLQSTQESGCDLRVGVICSIEGGVAREQRGGPGREREASCWRVKRVREVSTRERQSAQARTRKLNYLQESRRLSIGLTSYQDRTSCQSVLGVERGSKLSIVAYLM